MTWDARCTDSLKPLNLTPEDIRDVLQSIHGKEANLKIEWLNEQDTYYVSRKRKLTLPVWKVQIDDADASCYYIHPYSGEFRYVNRPARWQHWAYPALHSLQIPELTTHPRLWYLIMWILMLGGTFVSLSGFWLAIQYIRRKIKSRRWK